MADDQASGPSAETEQAIMQATYRALCKHGYANLTMQSIADEFDRTKGVLHYHYDTKQDLLVAFIEYLLDAFNANLAIDDDAPPDERLETFIDVLLLGSATRRGTDREFDHWELTTALLEIRSEAPHNEDFQRQLTHNFDAIQTLMTEIISEGVEQGVFRDVDPVETSTFLLASINGARIYQVTLDDRDVAVATRDALETLVRDWLCRPSDPA